MRFGSLLGLSLLLPLCQLQAQSVIINELYNSSSTGEWVELLVLQDDLDMRGWSLRDFSSSGSPQVPLVFSSSAVWNGLPSGTLIVIGDAGFAGATDTDVSDRILTVKSTDAVLFSGTVFSFAGSSDAIQIRNASAAHVAGVSWGAGNVSSLGAPKVHFAGSLPSATVAAFQGSSTTDLGATTSWQFGVSGATPGAGNSAANVSWITSLRATADGSGAASVDPDTLTHGQSVVLSISYVRDTAFTITDLRVIVPSAFSWSRTVPDVLLTGATATVTVTGDTIVASGIAISAQACTVHVASVGMPDRTGRYPVAVQSKCAVQYRDVAPVPTVTVFGLPESMSDVKGNDASGIPLRSGQLVTVRGVVTVANEFGGPSYLQDNTGGIAVFGSAFSTAVQVGDEVVVSGIVDPYNGLTELTSPILHLVASTGNTVAPVTLTCGDIANDGIGGVETTEGLLVRINDVVLRDASGNPLSTWAMSGSGTNHRLLDATDTLEVRVDDRVNFANTPAPQGPFDLIGVVGQFKSTLPFIGGYQLLPRFAADILATGPGFASTPVESDLTPTGFHIRWTTHAPGTSGLRYGLTPAYETGFLTPDTVLRTAHDVSVQGLLPATIYYLQAFSRTGTDTSWSGTLVASTASSPEATGTINAYFNKSVFSSLDPAQPASGNVDLVARLVARINAARRSIDAAFYSLSGTPGPGTDIAQALLAARAKGVKVRVICEQDNRNTSPLNSLVSGGIPLITDAADAINGGVGLMHNKFLVFDGRGGAPESVWVWTGSWNPTDPGTSLDYQNAIEIQDPALAGAYTLEFNEMWGSAGDTPLPASSRFGSRKADNTPHRFVIGGRPVLCYFSPSDRTTSRILQTLASADYSISFALLTLTRSDLAGTILSRRGAGVTVHGVMDNGTDAGSQYGYLTSQGVDVRLKQGTGLLHHKYGIIDAGHPSSQPTVITGSHNWTNAAENSNSENTLVIEDHALAMHYLQEFAARYYQYGGTDTIRVHVAGAGAEIPGSVALLQNYPNPFNPATTIPFELPAAAVVRITVYDVLGREVAVLANERFGPGAHRVVFDARGYASGVYLTKLQVGESMRVRRMHLVR